MTPCLPGQLCSNGEIYLLRRRGRKNQAGGLRIRLRMAMARGVSDHEHTKIGGTFCPFFPLLSQGRMSKIDLKIDREIEGSGAESGGPGPSQATSRRVRCLDRGLPRGDKPLWLGANNPTPGLRKTLTAPASRRGPWSLGACALGAPTFGGEKSASSAKEI